MYLCLVQLQLSSCSPVWRPNLLKDIKSLERVQRRATKFILGDSKIQLQNCLLLSNLVALMYSLEMNDVRFFLRSIKDSPLNFNILDYVCFCLNSTHSSTSNKLNHAQCSFGVQKFFYFHQLPQPWNCLPPIDITQLFNSIKYKNLPLDSLHWPLRLPESMYLSLLMSMFHQRW